MIINAHVYIGGLPHMVYTSTVQPSKKQFLYMFLWLHTEGLGSPSYWRMGRRPQDMLRMTNLAAWHGCSVGTEPDGSVFLDTIAKMVNLWLIMVI